MKQEKQHLVIPFSGLKNGAHQFSFDIDAKFFEQFEKSIIQEAKVHIDIDFLKKENMLLLDFSINGVVLGECDRCTENVDIPISGEEHLIVRFGEESFEETDEIKVIAYGEHELELDKEVYDYVHLLLPNKMIHFDEKNCNQEVINKLKKLSINHIDKEGTDPRWSVLLNLKDKNK